MRRYRWYSPAICLFSSFIFLGTVEPHPFAGMIFLLALLFAFNMRYFFITNVLWGWKFCSRTIFSLAFLLLSWILFFMKFFLMNWVFFLGVTIVGQCNCDLNVSFCSWINHYQKCIFQCYAYLTEYLFHISQNCMFIFKFNRTLYFVINII